MWAYKAPLSLHADHDAVVTPFDTPDPNYELTRWDAVDDTLLAETVAWGEAFTAIEHTDCVEILVEHLWPEYVAEHDDWRSALEAWVADERERDVSQATATSTASGEPRQSAASQLVEIEELVKRYCKEWDTTGDGYHFNPGKALWKDSDSGRTCCVFPDRNIFWDEGAERWSGGGGPEKFMALVEGIIDSPAETLTDADREQARAALRRDGYDVPLHKAGRLPTPAEIRRTFQPRDDHVEGLVPVEDPEVKWCCRRCEELLYSDREARAHARDCDIVPPPLTEGEVADRTEQAERQALREGQTVIIAPPPSAGKSARLPAAVAATGEPATLLVNRGHKEEYEQAKRR